MPENVALAEVHSPITNIVAGTTPIGMQQKSPSHLGQGAHHGIADGEHTEKLRPQRMNENAFETPPLDILAAPDIGAASFGPPNDLFEVVIGTDQRVRITDTTQYPCRCTASLLITAADNTLWAGTGWFISPRTLITAGHCVYIKTGLARRLGWVKSIQVMPGRNGNILPFGSKVATEFWTVKGWADQKNKAVDYGAIILPAAFDTDIGHLGFGAYPDLELLASIANIEGYPTDKPKGTLWYDSRKIGDVKPDQIYYEADTESGTSGAAVYIIKDGVRSCVGIHTYGDNQTNSGTRISTPVLKNLQDWKR